MNTAQNKRHHETEAGLRKALLFYLEQGKEPTVGQLCEKAGINRSTFYRHYCDVYDLMEKQEQEFQHGLLCSLQGDETLFLKLRSRPDVLEAMIAYIGQNPSFYRVYLQRHLGLPLSVGFRRYWEAQVKPHFLAHGVKEERHMQYYYESFKASLVTILRLWLENGCPESPQELSRIILHTLPEKPGSR